MSKTAILIIGLGLGAYVGYSIIPNDLGVIVGGVLGAYLASKF